MKSIDKNVDLIQVEGNRIEALSARIAQLMAEARNKVASAVNTAMVYTYYEIGRYIVEDEQEGEYRAKYGKQVLIELSARLTEKLGKGWSVENLTAIRKFYLTYSNSVTTGYEIQTEKGKQCLPNFTMPNNMRYICLTKHCSSKNCKCGLQNKTNKLID